MGFFDSLFKRGHAGDEKTKKSDLRGAEIIYFKLSINNCSACEDVYEGRIKADTAMVEHLSVRSRWEGNEQKEDRQLISRIKGEEELVNSLEAILKKGKVSTWNGFSGKNPPGVLDGSSMSFEARLSNGEIITASGSNNFPKGYRELREGLYELVNKTVLSSEAFELQDCTITVPREWLGIVSVVYAEYGACFMMDNEGKETAFLRFDYSNQGYSDNKKDVRAGRIIKGDDVNFISFHFFENNFKENITEKQLNIINGFKGGKGFERLVESIKAINGAVFSLEDGKQLYYEDVRSAFSDARSFWLSLNLGGEYSSGCKNIMMEDKKYVSFLMQNKYPKHKSVEMFKASMCELFDKSFVDELIDKKISEGKLLLHEGEVYVDYKRLEDNARYGGFCVDGIDQMDDDHAIIRVAVRRASPNDEKYHYSETENIEFEMIRNDRGDFVFKTFPYWDR